MTSLEQAIVKAVLKNLDDRSGFDHWWGSIDRSIQREIREDLAADVRAVLDKAAAR